MNPYICPECQDETSSRFIRGCKHCARTGLDPALIDLPRWQRAYADFLLSTGHSWQWIEAGIAMGQTNARGERLAYADFLLPELS